MDEETGTTLPTASLSGRRQWIITDLDLEPIVVKAMDAEEGHGWTFGFADQVSREYRRFLVLCLEYPQDRIMPSRIINDFWHLHILDTEKYIEDCQHCFGSILHHFPYFEIRGDKDAANLHAAYMKTFGLYWSAFGTIAPYNIWDVLLKSGIGIPYHGVEDTSPNELKEAKTWKETLMPEQTAKTLSHTVRNKAGARQGQGNGSWNLWTWSRLSGRLFMLK
ncbi:MAG: hypothetical protein F4Y87_01050 [Synechococcus sp. SB0665_bin_28]|nr:hypothetical protein [Synechococcus sp. SB0665_bin_28]MYF19699.1 hypothetical protein [Synechococcus sp. SB0677_bin_5]